MADGGVKCIKLITLLINFLFALTGLACFTVGLIVQLKYNHYSNFVGDEIWTVPLILMIGGAVVLLICFLGFYGICKENSCITTSFGILVTLIVVIEICMFSFAYIKHSDLKNVMEQQFNMTMQKYDERRDFRDVITLLQTELKCCGTYGPEDWKKVSSNSTLPSSCCTEIKLDEASECTIKHAHPDGCFPKLYSILDSKPLILGVVLTVVIIQVLTIFFAFWLSKSFRRNYHTV